MTFPFETRKWFSFWLNDEGVSVRTGREIFLCSLVGLVVGFAAVGFAALLECVRHYLGGMLAGYYPSSAAGETVLFSSAEASGLPRRWVLFLLPGLGAFVAAILCRKLSPGSDGHGTDAAINAYHRKEGVLPASAVPVKAVASALVIGCGGSAGCEGPVTLIGAACASTLARLLKLSVRERRILLAAGLGAGVGALFRAPLAGALFATEVLYRDLDLEFEVLIPAMAASTVAYSVFASFFGWQPLFAMPQYAFTDPEKFIPYIVLALVIAFGVRLNILVFRQVELYFRRLAVPDMAKPLIGGLLTGALGVFLPEVLGTGYGLVQQVLSDGTEIGGAGNTSLMTVQALLLLFAVKMFATAFTVGSGGSGGLFGPALVSGALLGAATGLLVDRFLPVFNIRIGAFALVGMAGFLSASVRTPLTAVLMISEITGNHGLLIPSMMVCGTAFLLCRRWTLYRSQVQNRFCSPAHAAHSFSNPTGEAVL